MEDKNHMKTKSVSKKLTLNKATITHLSTQQMNIVKGGSEVGSWCYGCNSQPPKCTVKLACWA